MVSAQPPLDRCPQLVEVTVDALWLYPVSVFCRGPRDRVRVPAAATLLERCTTEAYRQCPGYRARPGLTPGETPPYPPPRTSGSSEQEH